MLIFFGVVVFIVLIGRIDNNEIEYIVLYEVFKIFFILYFRIRFID